MQLQWCRILTESYQASQSSAIFGAELMRESKKGVDDFFVVIYPEAAQNKLRFGLNKIRLTRLGEFSTIG
jgi:hypothetical protein